MISRLLLAANLARWFPPWTVTREQWTSMTWPAISGVAVDTLLFSRIGVPLFHVTSLRRRHRRSAQDLVAWMSGTSLRDTEDRTADVSPRPKVTRRSVSGARRPPRPVGGGGGGRFFQDHEIGPPSSFGSEHCTSSDGFGASSI